MMECTRNLQMEKTYMEFRLMEVEVAWLILAGSGRALDVPNLLIVSL